MKPLVALLFFVLLVAVVVVVRLTVSPSVSRFVPHSNPDVLAISLKRHEYRRTRLSRQAPEVVYIDAVDGSLLNPEDLTIRRGETGCWLSHVKAWKRIARSHRDFGVILEDDANIRLPEQWDDIMRCVSECPPDWDIIFLGINNPSPDAPRVGPNTRVLPGDAFGMHAIVMRRKAARTLLKTYARMGMKDAKGQTQPVDFWVSRQPLKKFWADPVLVNPFDIGDSETVRVT